MPLVSWMVILKNVGLQETVSRAMNAVQKTGDILSGGITFENDSILAWFRNTDWAKIGFKNNVDSDTDSYMWFETGDNGNEYFKWQINSGTITQELMNLKLDLLHVLVSTVINGALGIGTDNALGGNSISLGDNDTGIKQGGDGVLLFYSNGQLLFGLQPASADFYRRVAYIHQGISPDGSGAFADQLNNATAPFVQTQFAWNPVPGGHYVPIVKGLSVRNGQGYPGAVSFGYLLTEQQGFPIPCIHMRGDGGNDALWQFNPADKSIISPGALIAGGARFNVDGNIVGGCWGTNLYDYLDGSFIRNVRLGGRRSDVLYRGGLCEPGNGHVTTGLQIIGEVDGDDWMVSRPLQKYIFGNWYNVEQA